MDIPAVAEAPVRNDDVEKVTGATVRGATFITRNGSRIITGLDLKLRDGTERFVWLADEQ